MLETLTGDYGRPCCVVVMIGSLLKPASTLEGSPGAWRDIAMDKEGNRGRLHVPMRLRQGLMWTCGSERRWKGCESSGFG